MNITLNITDTCCSKCYKNTTQKTETFTSRDQSISLQCNYYLNVLSVENNVYSILIQNGDYVIIRNILPQVSTSISIPSNCTHILTITSV